MTPSEAIPESRTSDILHEVLQQSSGHEEITIGQFMRALGERAFGIAILIFSLPNSLPIPSIPGFSAVTGVPIILIGVQLMLGSRILWLPKRVANYKFSPKKLASILIPALRYVRKAEIWFKPRIHFLSHPFSERVIGLLFILLGGLLALPIPFGNFLPGISITLIALGLTERDGIVMMLGTVFGAFSFTVISSAVVIIFNSIAAYLLGFMS